jgi:translation initiation factor IF-3
VNKIKEENDIQNNRGYGFSRSREPKNSLAGNYLVNERIRDLKIQVIDGEGQNLGVLSKRDALLKAQESGLDLVQVGKKDDFAVAKIMDFGKFLYIKKKQLGEAKKKQKVIQVKEIKIRPNIGDQDYNTKMNQAITFLQEGKKVKFTLQFKGREVIMIRELGQNFFNKIHKDLVEKNLGNLLEEKEQRIGSFWSKIYYLK